MKLLERIRPAVRSLGVYLVSLPESIRVKVNQNENPYDWPEPLKRELAEQLIEQPWNRYPDEFAGMLRQRLGERDGLPAESVLVSPGSNELTYYLGLMLVEPGAKVILPTPMFSLYRKMVQLYEGELIEVPATASHDTDIETILDLVHEHQPALTVLTTPNNPTGRVISFADVKRVVEAAEGFVLVDEAYVEFLKEPSAATLIERHPNVLVLRTFSKAAALAGVRIGYLLGHPEVIAEMMRARLPFLINRFTEAAALHVLDHDDVVQDTVRRMEAGRDELMTILRSLPGVEPVESSANFIIFRTPQPAARIVRVLADAGILVRNVSGYPGLEGYVRVSVGTPAENRAFVDALELALESEPV
ncbi:MAG: histidinol-phosphate transaminase [Bacteroidota bacterium]